MGDATRPRTRARTVTTDLIGGRAWSEAFVLTIRAPHAAQRSQGSRIATARRMAQPAP